MLRLRSLLPIVAMLPLAGCATDRRNPSDIPAMVRIAPGHFLAGSDRAETDAVHYPDLNAAREQPAHMVTVARAFAIGRTEVTRGQFAKFAAATGWAPDGPCSFLVDGPPSRWDTDRAHDWQHPGFAQTDAHPVVCVNTTDAEAYAAWLSRKTGRHFRLPSNAEWEYAARAGTVTAVYWGDRPAADACRFANVLDASNARAHNRGVADPVVTFPCNDGYPDTAPVGSFRPNRWGLYDMIGNVWELTLDCLNANQVGAPTDTRPRNTGDCASRIDRGASWTNTRKYVRAAAQHPDLIVARTSVLGFRLVEDLP
ncbi:formylglycine-generating enzyme family protein [Sphingomonas sp. AR_OL41]|uniref:formylglycine-generating enzyme family protein n=1 Tax=Sphingomonas sp. AR_OL41 TaxID=3042729 RepID=UPI00247FDF1A|nr:formylglycine-generating enzyme family protein [Sphingomonas sp. AR_OL41]MDH7973220.1 formylglycine-generating enzyme family protein [Sphingomonas sp. AR_OL41]